MSDSGPKGKEGEPGKGDRMSDDKEEKQCPNCGAELEIEDEKDESVDEAKHMVKPEPEPEPDQEDVCLHAGDVPPNCGSCDFFNNCTCKSKVDPIRPTAEPADAAMSKVAVDMSVIYPTEELQKLLGQEMTTTGHRKFIDQFKTAIVRHMDINPTKGISACTATVVYLQMLLVPREVMAVHVIQMIDDIFTAFHELLKEVIYSSRLSTPTGTKPH